MVAASNDGSGELMSLEETPLTSQLEGVPSSLINSLAMPQKSDARPQGVGVCWGLVKAGVYLWSKNSEQEKEGEREGSSCIR